jgi:protein-tyrosine phosphatase
MENIYNFRDFGGYQAQDGTVIKKGLLYRCASLANASDNDLNELSSLGIRTICDLRSRMEKKNEPDRIPAHSDIKVIHLPIKATRDDEVGLFSQLTSFMFGKTRNIDFYEYTINLYQDYVTEFRSEFSEILKLAADSSNLPILIHCTAGKDRTGLACGLIQLALGVSLELVIKDYLLTNEYLHEFKEDMLKKLKYAPLFGISKQRFLPLFEARPEYLQVALDQIRLDYGNIENYIRNGLEFSVEDRLKLGDLLLLEAGTY